MQSNIKHIKKYKKKREKQKHKRSTNYKERES